MLATPQIVQTAAQSAAIIHLTVPRNEMMKVFGPAVGELMAVLTAQGVRPEGALFAHHLKMNADTFDFELGVKVSSPVKATGRVTPGERERTRKERRPFALLKLCEEVRKRAEIIEKTHPILPYGCFSFFAARKPAPAVSFSHM
jgi:hypothetical protein